MNIILLARLQSYDALHNTPWCCLKYEQDQARVLKNGLTGI